MADLALSSDIDVMEPEEKEFSISGGSFFKENPDKLLAEEYEASGRFGKVKKYKPKEGLTAIDTLKIIQTPVFIGHGISEASAGSSVISTPVSKISGPEASVNIIAAIENSETGIVKRQRTEKRELQSFDEPAAKPTIPFEDVLRNYNKNLSDDEIKAFLWYMHTQGNTYKGHWLNILNPTILSQDQESAYINRWVKDGILFYYKSELLPAFLYFSENLYDKKAQLERDKDEIISIYGQQAYDSQESKMNEAFTQIYNNRLKLDDPDLDKRLHLKPYGDFTNSIEIHNWNLDNQTGEPKPFNVQISGSEKTSGQINWKSKKTVINEWRDPKRDLLGLNDAFRWYLKFDPNRPSLPHNFQWEDIFRYYLDKGKAPKDMDPTVVARNRALAKEVGDKIFSTFLAEIILENDRVMIERVWNEKFNSNLPLRTEKIPVAFEVALSYWGNETMVIEPEKREAVAFASIRGSSLNAYQVGVGKANLMTSDILTPKGWVKMKDIKVGMEVISKAGKPTKVLKVFPQGVMPAYRVTMSDGSFTEVTGDHFWTVQNLWDRHTGEWRLMTTLEMAKRLYNQRNDRIYSIPMVEPVQFEHKDVPFDPYLLGALLGDGGLTGDVSFSNPEIEVQDKIRKIVESAGLLFTPEKGHPDKDFRITKGNNGKIRNHIFDSLKGMGLMGKKSIDKFIPEIYLYNSVEVRLALLQGIMDTDGYVNKNGHCTQICTSSLMLAKNIVELVRSFGGTVNENIKHPKYTYKGELKEGHEAYVLTICLPGNIIPFTTKKHLDRFKPKTKYKPVRFINSIEPIGKHEAQCIRVENPDHLYVCDEYIVTHNTPSAAFTIGQYLDAGHCKRPFLVVPNQVYKQFYSELHGLLPHRKINDLYNLSKDHVDKLLDENGKVQMVEEGSISMFTYEGFLRIGFNEETQRNLLDVLKDALDQIQTVAAFNDSKSAEKDAIRKEEKLKGMLGKALQKSIVNIEELGFDFVCFDEAHTLKNIFSQVKAKKKPGEAEGDKDEAGKKMYDITGSTSTKGIKAYCLCSYLQMQNNGRNVLLLTATPFSNSPLEIFSMLSLVAYQDLKKLGLSNINDFFDNYCQMSYELIINSKLQPIRKQIFKAFDNLQSLRKLVYKYMLHKEAGRADSSGNVIALVRPDKWVLPYKGHYDAKNAFFPAKEDEFINTIMPLTNQQKNMMDEIISYVEGNISYDSLSKKGMRVIDDEDEPDLEEGESRQVIEEAMVLDETMMDDKEKAGVKTLRGVNFARSLALSPYLYEFSGLGEPSYIEYVESSPKLVYIVECVRSVKKWHEEKKEAPSGQVIYMDRGKKYFGLLKEYLINKVGYKEHEIGIIRSGKEGSAKHKDAVKNGFNGYRFNEATKSFEDIPEEERIKIIIGTSSIREGLNLNRYSTVLYNASIDWRPTDEIQLEGRIWRQGNSFSNIRIVIPLMSDSMDIFMFEKLAQKTELINSIWDWDGKSNVLKIEELDPKELKMELITNPKVIAQLKLDDIIIDIDEKVSEINNIVQTANNVISFYDKRIKFETELNKVLSIIHPDKQYPSVESMMADFEKELVKIEKDRDYARELKYKLQSRIRNTYEYEFVNYNHDLHKPWSYGNMRGAVAMLKKAKRSFLDKYNIADDKEAVQVFINEQEAQKERMEETKRNVASDDHIEELIAEIERERKEKKIRFKTVQERVDEFKKLNYLLGIKANISHSEDFKMIEIAGCPPTNADGTPDVSVKGIKAIESCLEQVPQTKALNTDESGEYTEARLKLHKVIKGKLRAGMRCSTMREKPIAILTGGVPGSGKTTFLKKYAPNLEKEKIFKIDADEIRSMLPEYKGWNSKATHKETQDIYRGLLNDISEGKPCRFDILWDGTMNKADNYLPLLADLKRLNYEIFMIYVQVPWDVSRKRTIERYVRGSKDGNFGRYVPMAVVDEANQNGIKAFDELKFKADGFMVVDGMTGQVTEKGGKDLLVDRGYFDKEPTDKDVNLKKAKAKAIAQKQRIRILKLKDAEEEIEPIQESLDGNMDLDEMIEEVNEMFEGATTEETNQGQEYTGSLITSVAPFKEAFLKRKGLSLGDAGRLTEKEKNKLSKEWLKSQEYKDMENRDNKEVFEKYNK